MAQCYQQGCKVGRSWPGITRPWYFLVKQNGVRQGYNSQLIMVKTKRLLSNYLNLNKIMNVVQITKQNIQNEKDELVKWLLLLHWLQFYSF